MEKNDLKNSGDKKIKIVLACSGGSDIGELTDRVARKLKENNVYNMKCLAMVAAGDKNLHEAIKSTETLVIDGCPVDCGRKIMEEAWITNYQYVRLTDMGLEKGKTPVTDELIEKVFNQLVGNNKMQTVLQPKSGKGNCCGCDSEK